MASESREPAPHSNMGSMMSNTILAVTWGQGLVTTLFVVVCVFLILVILLQKGRGGGLSGAFGGVGGHSAFGAKTGDVFTWITVGLTGLFILMAVVGNWVFRPSPTVSAAPAVVTPAPGGEAAPDAQPGETGAGTQPS